MFLRILLTFVLLLSVSAYSKEKGFSKRVISQPDANGFYEVEYVLPPEGLGKPGDVDMSDMPKLEGFDAGRNYITWPPGYNARLDPKTWMLYIRGNAEHHKFYETLLKRLWAKSGSK